MKSFQFNFVLKSADNTNIRWIRTHQKLKWFKPDLCFIGGEGGRPCRTQPLSKRKTIGSKTLKTISSKKKRKEKQSEHHRVHLTCCLHFHPQIKKFIVTSCACHVSNVHRHFINNCNNAENSL